MDKQCQHSITLVHSNTASKHVASCGKSYNNHIDSPNRQSPNLMKKGAGISDKKMELYESLIASIPGVERKGASMPYTSLNGHMFSFLTPEGALALRLPTEEREAFLKKYKTTLCEQHGRVMKEYVVVPDRLLKKTAELQQYFQCSVDYVGSLKPKATTKKTTKKSGAKKKSVKRSKK